MYVKKKVYVELTKEEKDTLKKAQEILIDFENFSSTEQNNDLQDLYENYVDHYVHDYALSTAIDFIGAILEKGEIDDEIWT